MVVLATHRSPTIHRFLLPTLSVLPSSLPSASATMSFPPLDPGSFLPTGTAHSAFIPVEDRLTALPLSIPESDPDVVVGDDDSVAIDCVRALLDSDFSESRTSWIHLLMALVTDARNGLLTSVQHNSLSRFDNLSPSETLHLNSLKRSLESLDTFFADTQDDPEDWITCMGCATTFQLPVSKDDWDVYLSKCSGDITATCTLIVDEAIEAARPHVQAWADGQRVSAQDAAIQRLTSDHSPEISDLISDPRLIEWSGRLLEAMKFHFTETLVTKASHTLPTRLIDLLDAERQSKVDAARRDARAEAKRLYHAELTRLQSNALSEVAKDFETWKSTTLIPEWQAKEASAKAEKLQELDAFKHGIAIELEEHKENARLTAAKSLVLSKTESRSRRKEHCPDPTRGSRSVSHAHSPSPSPSQKLDKTPTKADFQVSSHNSSAPLCAPVSDHARGRAGPSVAQEFSASVPPTRPVVPLAGPDIAKASVGTLGDADSGLPSTPTSCLPEALPSAAPLETVPPANVMDVVMAPAAPLGDASPSSVRPVSGPNVTSADIGSSLAAPLVARYQSTTPSPTPMTAPETLEERLVRLLGLQITASLAPIQSSVSDIGLCLRAVEGAVEEAAPWGGDDVSLGIGGYDKGYNYGIPTTMPSGGEEHVDYHVASAPSRAVAEDEELAAAQRQFRNHDDNEDPHLFFEETIMAARNQARSEIDPAQLATLASLAAKDWDDFCSRLFIDRLALPPPPFIREAYVTHTHVNLVKAQMEDDLARAIRGDSAPLSGLSFTGPYLSTTRDNPLALPRPSRLSEPLSISSDGSKVSGFTESSPTPAVPISRPRQAALDLDTPPPPGDGAGWTVMGGKCGRSFASIAASASQKPTPSAVPLPPSAVAAAHGFLTRPQLDSLTRAQVINAYNARFTPKLGPRVPKERTVIAFLNKASRPVPSPTPSPCPVTKTEFTLVYDTCAGDLSAPSGHRGDAASYVREIQKHVRAAGTKQAELIGGRWTSQTSRNFVLTFNGNPSLDEVLWLRLTFARVLGPHYSIVPTRGYTRVVLNSVPTMCEMLGAPLPSAAALRTELAGNAGLKDLILLGEPYWLMARTPNARHGSISFAFLDPDGSRLKDILRNPPFLFGNRSTRPRKYKACPLISQCVRCWALGHNVSRCPCPKDTVVCPICAGAHAKDEHHKKCQAVSKHTEVYCTCPIVCINCRRARKPAKGHSALSLSCPLRSKFRSPIARTGDSSDEEKNGVNIAAAVQCAPSPDVVMLSDGESPAPPTVAPASSI